MDRRHFLRMLAGVATTLGLSGIGVAKAVAKEPDTLRGIPSKNVKPGETLHTEWIECSRYEKSLWTELYHDVRSAWMLSAAGLC